MNDVVVTPRGVEIGEKRGLVGKGEVFYDFGTGEDFKVPFGTVGKDNIPTDVGERGRYDSGYDPALEDYDNRVGIAGNNVNPYDPQGRTFALMAGEVSDDKRRIEAWFNSNAMRAAKHSKLSSLFKNNVKVSQTVKNVESEKCNRQLEHILAQQALSRPENQLESGLMRADSGKIPTFARILPTLTGVGASLAKLAHWTSNPIRQVNTYQLNPYGNRALNILGSMRANPYPAIKEALDAERRGAYSINRSGGMSGSQRYLGRVAQSVGNAQNIANINFAAEQENNKYKQNFANALLQEGNSIALRRQQALQHDWADYVASHGRKTAGIEQSLADMVGQVGSGFQNEFKYRTYQDTLDLYRQEVENNTKNTRNTRLMFNPTQAYIRNPYIDDMYNRGTKKTKKTAG